MPPPTAAVCGVFDSGGFARLRPLLLLVEYSGADAGCNTHGQVPAPHRWLMRLTPRDRRLRNLVGLSLVATLLVAAGTYEVRAVSRNQNGVAAVEAQQREAVRLKDEASAIETRLVYAWAITGRPAVDAQVLRDGRSHLLAMHAFFTAATEGPDGAMNEAAERYLDLLNRAGVWFAAAAASGGPTDHAELAVAIRLSDERGRRHRAWIAAGDSHIARVNERVRRQVQTLIGLAVMALLLLVAVLFITRARAAREREEVMERLKTSAADMARLASTDPLTGLHNQREFYAHLERELADDSRRPVALALIDVDDFKRINDRFGHLVGDQVLVEIAGRLSNEGDGHGALIARVGGEEFGVVVPADGDPSPRVIAERLRASVQEPINPVGAVTVSVGIAHGTRSETAVSLFRRADQALYAAKHAGKNCVQVAEDALSLFDELHSQAGAVETFGALSALVSSVDRVQSMEGHSQRVARVAAALARHAGWAPERVARIRQAALLHDVGKVAVPSGLLSKARGLTSGEHGAVSAHPALGSEMVRRALDEEQAAWVLHHHERWDGSGYPDGLAGDEIPEGARILAIADAWDAMTTDRLYAPALDERNALAEISSCRGTQFWPRGIDLMMRVAHHQPARDASGSYGPDEAVSV